MCRNRMWALAASVMLLLWSPAVHAQVDCTVTFSLDDPVALGALAFDVGYDTAQIDVYGTGSGVACSGLLGNAVPSFNDDESAQTLSQAFVAFGSSFSGPVAVSSCDFSSTVTPVPGDFAVVVTDASDAGGAPVAPLPGVSVSNLVCTGGTTTTIPGATTTTTSTTTTTLASNACVVTLRLLNIVTLGALQFDVDYSGAGGWFDGSDGAVNCTKLVSGSLATFSDDDAGELLSAAYVSTVGFTGPTDLAQCLYFYDTVEPIPNDFVVTVTDASAPDQSPKAALVRVSTVDCGLGSSTTTTSTSTSTTTTTTVPVCGDGIPQAGEECDDGLQNSDSTPDACRVDCKLPWCGDGTADSGEECDQGASNSDTPPTACMLDCTLPPMCGDADDNGSVTAADALRVLQNAVGNPVPCQAMRCDSNNDGLITAVDAQRVLRVSVGQPVVLDCP